MLAIGFSFLVKNGFIKENWNKFEIYHQKVPFTY